MENGYFTFTVICIFDQINAALKIIRDFIPLKKLKHKKIELTPNFWRLL